MLKKSLWQHQQMQNGKKNCFFFIKAIKNPFLDNN
jgi:hypothetical protein